MPDNSEWDQQQWETISPLIIPQSEGAPFPGSATFSQVDSRYTSRNPYAGYPGGGGGGPSSLYQQPPPSTAPAWFSESTSRPQWPLASAQPPAGGRNTPYPAWSADPTAAARGTPYPAFDSSSSYQQHQTNTQGRPGATPFHAGAALSSSRGPTPQVPQQQQWWPTGGNSNPSWPPPTSAPAALFGGSGSGSGGGSGTPQTASTQAGSFPVTPQSALHPHPEPHIVQHHQQAQYNPYFPALEQWGGGGGGGADLVRARSTTGKKSKSERRRRRVQSVSARAEDGAAPGLLTSPTYPFPPGYILSPSGYPAPTPSPTHLPPNPHLHPQISPTFAVPLSPPTSAFPPAYALPDEFNERNLAKRPRDWRADYDPRGGLVPGVVSLFPRLRKGVSDVSEYTDPIKRTIHPLLLYSQSHPPIYHDLRFAPFPTPLPSPISTSPPSSLPHQHSSSFPIQNQNQNQPSLPTDFPNLEFPNIQRKPNLLDLMQLSSVPSASMLRFYHPKLPWYIDIAASHPNGVTIYDILIQLHTQLSAKISARHYYNDVLGPKEREEVNRAFGVRCMGREEVVREGVRQVDFLGSSVVLRGFVRGKGGMWEVRTSEIQ